MAVTNESIEFLFPFRNYGDKDLRITGIHVDCSCIKSERPSEAVLPGKDGVIKLYYHVQASTGAFVHRAVVQTNDPESGSRY